MRIICNDIVLRATSLTTLGRHKPVIPVVTFLYIIPLAINSLNQEFDEICCITYIVEILN